MSKISKGVAVFVVVLALAIIWGLFASTPVDPKTPVDTKNPVDTETQVQINEVGGLLIEFEDGTTEQEVKAILENGNIPVNYSIDYNSDIMPNRYYIMVEFTNLLHLSNAKSF